MMASMQLRLVRPFQAYQPACSFVNFVLCFFAHVFVFIEVSFAES